MRLRLIPIFMTALLLSAPAMADDAPGVSAHAAVLISRDTGEVLYERNAHETMLIASTTKIMTAVVVLEHCGLDDAVTIDASCTGVEGSSMYLKAGEEYTVEQLLYGLLLESGNDAAEALAFQTAGNREAFAELMNQKAAELGMTDSSFRNPSGLDEDGHYSTAADMAVLTRHAMGMPEFERIVSSRSYDVAGRTMYNHNRLLSSYDGCVGVKTGYTREAGRSLVSCAVRDGTGFICVTLGAPDDWNDHAALYDWAFASYRYAKVIDSAAGYTLPVISGVSDEVRVLPSKDVYALLRTGDTLRLAVSLPPFVFAPTARGEQCGSVIAMRGDSAVAQTELHIADACELREGIMLTPWERFRRAWLMAGNRYLCPYYISGEL